MEINKIYNESNLETMKRMPDGFVNMIFTSPPYADRRKDTYGGIKEEDYVKWFNPIAKEFYRVVNQKGSFFLNIKEHTNPGKGRSLYVLKLVQNIVEDAGFILIDTYCWTRNAFPGKIHNKFKNAWEPVYHFAKQDEIDIYPDEVAEPIKPESIARAFRKNSGKPKSGSGMACTASDAMRQATKAYPHNHLHIENVQNQFSENEWHPAVFPEDLPAFFIKAFTKQGDVVYDPFSGSATTPKMAHLLLRNWVASELRTDYADKSNKRLLPYQQQQNLFKQIA